MTTILKETDAFLADFDHRESRHNAGLPAWVHRLRRGAIARFAEVGLPTISDEEWRFTSLAPLAKTVFEPAEAPIRLPTPEQLDAAGLPRLRGLRLVLVDGHWCPELSSTENVPEGVTVASLAEVLRARPELVEPHLGRHADYWEHALVALNSAFLDDGAVVDVRPGAVVEPPIHLVYVSTGGNRPWVAHPRNLIVVGRHAEVKVVETYLGLDDGVYFNNAVTEVVLGDGAIVDHYKLQQEGPSALHVSTLQAQQQGNSTFNSHLLSLGAMLARCETNTRLADEGCHAALDGLYLARGRQHLDCHTQIDHLKSNGDSRELYKGILDDESHGVFNGKILVHPGAQKTDARQSNQTLLLSDLATIDTKPQLEIFADDVRCTHGATVAQLDAEALFYLRSRGIALAHARELLIDAFANEVLDQVRLGSLRAAWQRVLRATRGSPASILHEATA